MRREKYYKMKVDNDQLKIKSLIKEHFHEVESPQGI